MTTQNNDDRLVPLYTLACQLWAAEVVEVRLSHSFCGVYVHGLPLMVVPVSHGIGPRRAIGALEAGLRDLVAYQ